MNVTLGDLRAEVIISELHRKNKGDEVLIQRRGGFQRNYRADLHSFKFDKDSNRFIAQVNREGIYDYLPEELFHFDTFKTAKKTDNNYRNKHNKVTEQEQEARSFFEPFENEFSQLLVELELQEKQVMDTSVYNPFLMLFYESELENLIMSERQKMILTHLFPYLFKYKNSLIFFEFAIRLMIDQNIKVSSKKLKAEHHIEDIPSLGNGLLGIDTICGNTCYEEITSINVNILNPSQEAIKSFLPTGNSTLIINYLKNIFLSVTSEINVLLTFDEISNIYLSDECENSYLGYSSVL